MPLTDIALKAIKPAEKITRYHDEKGLYLEVSPAGGRWWRFKYTFPDPVTKKPKEKRISLGTYPEKTLKAAREDRDECRRLVKAGIDPSAERKEAKRAAAGEDTFETLARDWWNHWRLGNTPRHADYVLRRLEADVFPDLAPAAVNAVTTKMVVDVAKKIDKRGANDLARKQLNTISQIYRYGIAHGRAERNPAADIRPSDVLRPVQTKNMARIEQSGLPALLKAIDNYDSVDGKATTKLALRLMAHTFVRTSELIGGQWPEVADGENWRIPGERMKMDDPHIVPMSRQVKAILEELRAITGEGVYMFPGERGGHISNNTLLYALYRMGYKGRMTGHGFRGLASTILHEQGWPHEHIELQLAHTEHDEVSAAYNHALYLKQRAEMMQAWSDFLDQQRALAED